MCALPVGELMSAPIGVDGGASAMDAVAVLVTVSGLQVLRVGPGIVIIRCSHGIPHRHRCRTRRTR